MDISYQPGLHLLATLKTDFPQKLRTHAAFKALAGTLAGTHRLQVLGAVYHDFPGGGFTAVVGLSESHFSIHTWPEHGLANVDIYLSNYRRANEGTVRELFTAICDHLAAEVVSKTEITR